MQSLDDQSSMRGEAQYREALAPVTECMLALAGLAAGERVLDIGSGAGEMALLAAERAGATGFVVATDISLAQMTRLVQRRQALPAPDRLVIEETAAEDLTPEPDSFDVALARNCLMYFRDLPDAVRKIRAALRPGGRFVASIYGSLEREPFHAVPIAVVERRRAIGAPLPEYVQAFRVGSVEVERAVVAAGFRDIRSCVVATSRHYPSGAAAIVLLRSSPSLNELLSLLPELERDDAWNEIADGFAAYETSAGLKLPGEQLVITGIA